MFLAGAGMFSMRLYPVQDDAFRQNVVEELRYQGEKTHPPGRGEVRIEIHHFAKTGSGQTSKGRAPKKTAPPVYRFSSSDPADAPPRDCPLGFEQRGKETASFAPFFTKQDHVLQRQARDKHRESTHKRETCFLTERRQPDVLLRRRAHNARRDGWVAVRKNNF